MVLEELFQIFQNTDTKCISVGEFDIEKISFIKEKCPEALDNSELLGISIPSSSQYVGGWQKFPIDFP